MFIVRTKTGSGDVHGDERRAIRIGTHRDAAGCVCSDGVEGSGPTE